MVMVAEFWVWGLGAGAIPINGASCDGLPSTRHGILEASPEALKGLDLEP